MIQASDLHTLVKAALGKRELKNDRHWHCILENADNIIEYARNVSHCPSIYMEKYILPADKQNFPLQEEA